MFFPEEPFRADLDILVAGCGTNLAPIFAATMPGARIVGVDISPSVLSHSESVARTNTLDNIEHHQMPLHAIGALGQTFDYICVTGALQRMKNPAMGLRALGKVLRPNGAMSTMVYAKYGRQGVHMLQDLCGMLDLSFNHLDAARVQKLMTLLPSRHPFRLMVGKDTRPIRIEDVMDLVLDPCDASFAVGDVRSMVEASGLGFHRWLGNAEYRPEFTSLGGAGLGQAAAELDPWKSATAAELASGAMIKHSFVLTHPQRTPAEQLFAGTKIADAVPTLAAHACIDHEGDTLVVTNDAHQLPVRISAPTVDLAPVLKAANGTRTVAQIVGAAGMPGLELFRRLYHADAVTLSTAR